MSFVKGGEWQEAIMESLSLDGEGLNVVVLLLLSILVAERCGGVVVDR